MSSEAFYCKWPDGRMVAVRSSSLTRRLLGARKTKLDPNGNRYINLSSEPQLSARLAPYLTPAGPDKVLVERPNKLPREVRRYLQRKQLAKGIQKG